MKTLQDFILESQCSFTPDDIRIFQNPKDENKYILELFDKKIKKCVGKLNFTEGLIRVPVTDTVKKSKAIEIAGISPRDEEGGFISDRMIWKYVTRYIDICELLINGCIDVANDNKLDIYVYTEIKELIKLYEKLGFEPVPDEEYKHNYAYPTKEHCLVRRYKQK